MKEFDSIVTNLPYKESPGEVEQLVSRCKDNALAQVEHSGRLVRPWFYGVVSLAAAAAIAVGVFLSHSSSPIDSFLASLSDEEAAMIVDWPIDDIPECY